MALNFSSFRQGCHQAWVYTVQGIKSRALCERLASTLPKLQLYLVLLSP